MRYEASLKLLLFFKLSLKMQASALEALKSSDLRLLSDLLSEESDGAVDVDAPIEDERGKTLLFLACERADAEAGRILLAAGANPAKSVGLTGQTPLHAAVTGAKSPPNPALIGLLLASGRADVNATGAGGRTPLHYLVVKCARASADRRGHEAMRCLRLLLRSPGVKVDPRDDGGGKTPLHAAATANPAGLLYLATLRSLVAAGADWSLKCGGDDSTIRDLIAERVTAADMAALEDLYAAAFFIAPSAGEAFTNSSMETLVTLINDAELIDREEEDLMWKNWEAFQKALNEAPPAEELDATSVGKPTLVQRAAAAGLAKHVRSLLTRGCDPNATSGGEGAAPAVLLAARRGHHEVLAVLREHAASESNGAAFAAADERDGATALHAALRKPLAAGLSLRLVKGAYWMTQKLVDGWWALIDW